MGIFSFLTGKKTSGEDKKKESSEEGFSGRGHKTRLTESVHHAEGLMRLIEQAGGFPFSNPDQGTDFDDRLFLQIGLAAPLDLPPRRLQTLQGLSLLTYRRNPRSYRAIELVKDFVLGDGVKFHANDEKVQALLDLHWAVNLWNERAELRLRDLAIFGELLLPIFIRKEDGLVRLGRVVSPRVLKVMTDPDNIDVLRSVATSIGQKDTLAKGKIFNLVFVNDKGELEAPRQDPAFFFAVNRISGASRGLPDLSPSLDWLEGLDNFMFSLLERSDLATQIVFDISYKGLKDTELQDRADEFRDALAGGGIYTHNPNTELKIQTPQLGGSEAEVIARMIIKHIQAGTGLAGLFFGDSDDLTRASATEITVPVAKMIKARQMFFKRMLTSIFDLQIQEGVKAGTLKGVKDLSFEIDMPQIFLRDMTTITKSILQLSDALVVASDRQWITTDQAGMIFKTSIEQLGSIAEDGHIEPLTTTGGNNGKDTEEEGSSDAGKAERQGRGDEDSRGDSRTESRSRTQIRQDARFADRDREPSEESGY